MTHPYAPLISLLAERSACQGTFTLSSGRSSSFYIDARLTTMSPEGLTMIGPLAYAIVRAEFPDAEAIGGLTMGADPIMCAVVYASAETTHPLRGFSVRKESKAHGTGRMIEGAFHSGDRVVVVEDVITTGESALKAVKALQKQNAHVLGILAVVDREEGGREALEAKGFRVVALVRSSEIVEQLTNSRTSSDLFAR